MKTFVTGEWGRPHGLEQHVFRRHPNDTVVRFPNRDTYDILKQRPRVATAHPFESISNPLQYNWHVYYDQLKNQVRHHRPDLLVCCFIDDATVGGMWEAFGDRIPTLCVNREAARLENDRWYAREVTTACGVNASSMIKCATREEALRRVLESDWSGFVIKIPDAGSSIPGVVTEVYGTKEETLAALHARDEQLFPIVIEEKLLGYEIAFSCLVDYRNEMFFPMVTDFEYTKLATGDLGVETSEMGAHDLAGVGKKPQEEIFRPLMKWFKEVKYLGWFDASCMFNPVTGSLTVFEFMTRLGSSQFELAMTMMASDFVDVARQLWTGGLSQGDIDWRYKHGIGVTVVDASAMTMEKTRPTRIVGPIRELMIGRHEEVGSYDALQVLSRMDTQVNDDGLLMTRGDRVFMAMGLSDSFGLARDCAYNVARMCRFPGNMYRTDIGHRWDDIHVKEAMAEHQVLPTKWWIE